MFHLGQLLGEKWLRFWFSLETENLFFQRTTCVPVCPAPRAGAQVRGGDIQARRQAAGRGWVFQLWWLESISSAVGTGPDLGLQQTKAILKPMCLCEYSPVQDSELSLSSLLVSQTSEWVCQVVTEVCLQTPLQTKSSCRGS